MCGACALTRSSYIVSVEDFKPAKNAREAMGRGVSDALSMQCLQASKKAEKMDK